MDCTTSGASGQPVAPAFDAVRFRNRKGDTVTVETLAAGAVTATTRENLAAVRTRKRVADDLNLTPEQLEAAYLRAVGADGDITVAVTELPAPPAPAVAAEPPPPPEPFRVYVRGRQFGRRHAQVFEADAPASAVKAAIAYTDCPHAAPEAEWDGTDELACLDVDYHDPAQKPDRAALHGLANALADEIPGAVCGFVSHGGGVKLVFAAADGLTAAELAAVAAWRFEELRNERNEKLARRAYGFHTHVLPVEFKPTGVEIKSQMSHPGYVRVKPDKTEQRCGNVFTPCGLALPVRELAAALLGSDYLDADPEAVEELLEEKGWKFGQKLPHTECPIDPTPSGSDAHKPPVSVLDRGLRCFKCDRFTPWNKLVAPESVKRVERRPALRATVRGMAHWAHARHVVAHEAGKPSEKTAKQLYRALLKLWHLHGPTPLSFAIDAGTRELIDKVFGGDPAPIVRVAGGWISENNRQPVQPEALTKYVAGFPATLCTVRCGLAGVDYKHVSRPRVQAALLNNDDVAAAAVGYCPLRPLQCVDAFGQVGDPHAPGVPFVVTLQGREPFVYRPLTAPTIAGGDRVPFRHWDVIERAFPGINVNYLKLCVAGILFTQKRGKTEPDRIFVTGQSGSGKTTTPELAAELVGAPAIAVRLRDDGDKFLRSAAACAGGLMLIDECAKSGMSGDAFLSRVQAVKVGGEFHAMYQGSRRLESVPFQVFADTLIPRVVAEEIQLRRRFVYVDLGAGRLEGHAAADWQTTSGGIMGWRDREARGTSLLTNREVADAIVSEVLDLIRDVGAEYRKAVRREHGIDGDDVEVTFTAVAAALGFKLLSEQPSEDGFDHEAPYRELFDAYLTAEPTSDSKFKGRGWVVVNLGDASHPVAAALRACARDGFDSPKEQLTAGRQWGATVGVPGLRVDYVEHGRRAGIRFRVGDARSPEFRTHRDLAEPRATANAQTVKQ